MNQTAAEAISMKPVSILDVAPTLARTLGTSLPRSDGQPIEAVVEWGCKNAVLLIVDSLGYDLFRWLMPELKNMSCLAKAGVLFKADVVSDRTTPAIASILSGLLPEHHGIYDKAGAKESSLLSLPEIASSCGLKTAVVMEKNGAEVYEGLIEIVRGILTGARRAGRTALRGWRRALNLMLPWAGRRGRCLSSPLSRHGRSLSPVVLADYSVMRLVAVISFA